MNPADAWTKCLDSHTFMCDEAMMSARNSKTILKTIIDLTAGW